MGEVTRRDGTTTLQMKTAPVGAVFVWPNSHLEYPKGLARSLGRDDLRIESPSFFDGRWHGLRKPVILDHATMRMLTPHQRDGWEECMVYLAAHKAAPTG